MTGSDMAKESKASAFGLSAVGVVAAMIALVAVVSTFDPIEGDFLGALLWSSILAALVSWISRPLAASGALYWSAGFLAASTVFVFWPLRSHSVAMDIPAAVFLVAFVVNLGWNRARHIRPAT